MKKKVILSVAALLCLTTLVGCNKEKESKSNSDSSQSDVVRMTSLAVTPKRPTIYLEDENKDVQLTAVIEPENASNKAVTWTSDNEAVATVDANGKVTGKSQGTATITVKAVDGELKDTSVVSVKLSRSQDSRIDELDKPAFLAKYEKNTNNLDDVTTIQTNKNPSRSSYYKNADLKRDTYKVGNQNEFKFAITGKINDDRGREQEISNPYVNVKLEKFDKAQNKYNLVPESELADVVTISEQKNSYQFKEAATGNVYKITISPDETMYAEVNENCSDITFDVEVINGFNVYTKEDLTVFDNTETWAAVKAAKGLTDVVAKGIVLHDDIEITNDDLPASLKWSAAEIEAYIANYSNDFSSWCVKKGFTAAEGKATLTDSLRDWVTVFERFTPADEDLFAFEGNYFKIDGSKIKQIYSFNDGIQNGQVSNEYIPDDNPLKGNDGSHSQLFRIRDDNVVSETHVGASYTFRNMTITGNGERSDEDKYQGGLITFKMKGIDFIASNIITSRSFVTFMPNISEAGCKEMNMVLDRCKNFDSYNSLLYIWGTEKNVITNSFMTGAGGAIALLDEVHANDITSGTHGVPKVDCYNVYFDNPVTGNEPWFVGHQASALVQLMQAFGMQDKWLGKNANKNGEKMNILSTDGTNAYINIVAIDICGSDPLNNKLTTGGSMLKGHFNIYNDPEMTTLLAGCDMGKLAAADPAAGQDVFVGTALQEFATGNPLPLYRVMAAFNSAPGIIAQTATGHGMLSDTTYTNGVIAALNDSVAPGGSTPVAAGISITPIPFYNPENGSEIAYNMDAYKSNMEGLASGDYMSVYMQPGAADVEYLGVFLKLTKIA